MRKLLLIIPVSILVGCASVSMNFRDYEGDDGGYLVLTTIVPTAAPQAAGYFYRFRPSAEPDRDHYLYYSPGNLFHSRPADFEIDDAQAYVHVVRLQARQYDFYTWHVNADGWATHGNEELGLQFEIHPRQVTYAGAFMFRPYYGKNRLGMNVLAGMLLIPMPEADRDLHAAHQKRPEISGLPIHLALPSPGKTLSTLIQ